jgi:hypothetical protein
VFVLTDRRPSRLPARAYRAVHAGGFIHPLVANRAYEFVGDVALGREHTLH